MTAGSPELTAPIRQNWVISARADVLLIVAAPLLWFLWAAAFSVAFSPEIVIAIFLGFNVGHHLPTFIRIYGDLDLLKRFRYSLLLGPILPFSAAMCVSAYVILNELPLNNAMFIMLILIIWDPWHFLMQHFGFMRIYDRYNRAPRELARWMDLAISSAWFVHVLIAATGWLPNMLYTLYNYHALPLARLFASGRYQFLQQGTLVVAIVMTLVYAGYLLWCRRRGFYVSPAKVWMLCITLGVIYLTYVPNGLMERLLPNWSFSLGFAALGMVHVSQYLAIVWKYNRVLAVRSEHARPGLFTKLFSHGGIFIGTAYLMICLLYGFTVASTSNAVLSSVVQSFVDLPTSQWFLAVLMSISFTSTLMHYYYDGFIWKIRHKENQENLKSDKRDACDEAAESASGVQSWWDAAAVQSAAPVLLRQACYFLIPILILFGTLLAHQSSEPRSMPLESSRRARSLAEARESIDAMKRQAEIEQVMIQIRPRAQHHTYLAELTFAIATVEYQLDSMTAEPDDRRDREFREQVERSIKLMETGLDLPEPHQNPERLNWQRSRFEELLSHWRTVAAGIAD